MKRLLILLLSLITYSCKEPVENFIPHLNGYWEIEKVILASGDVHDYKYNPLVDYFKLTDSLKGYRKKLKPLLDGTFADSKDTEQFNIKIEHDSLNIYYNTKFSSWKETILSASDNQLKIINANKNIYIYKPYKPLNIN
ncbi:lipocalin family protein [Yeosuana marina]|jgi:hypothetical protein|uniref:lipocalin family protein n=1 Tax=Yeosuana marina TaxID=1565536 RepID=UPI00142130FC|nr:lipocalin family protein [Yeosuana marina]|tara:strand:+ start:437 stop:853 length:417 start_codon:yes stop_codon:yes gene_type:complete